MSSPAYRATLLFCYHLFVKTFLIVFAVLEIVALIYAAWYHLKGKDIDQKKAVTSGTLTSQFLYCFAFPT